MFGGGSPAALDSVGDPRHGSPRGSQPSTRLLEATSNFAIRTARSRCSLWAECAGTTT